MYAIDNEIVPIQDSSLVAKVWPASVYVHHFILKSLNKLFRQWTESLLWLDTI